MAAIPRVQIDPSDPPTLDVGVQLSLFCSDMRTQPEELEELKWRRNGEPLVTGGNIVVFPETGELVISDMQVLKWQFVSLSNVLFFLHVLSFGSCFHCLNTSVRVHQCAPCL